MSAAADPSAPSYGKSPDSENFLCQLVACRVCGDKFPQALLDANGTLCLECAIARLPEERKCEGRGMCFEQGENGDPVKKSEYRDCHCLPVACPVCRDKFPQVYLDANEDMCANCASIVYAGMRRRANERKYPPSLEFLRTLGEKYAAGTICRACFGPLQPLADRRANGTARHDDWAGRKYHKKCWLRMRREAEDESTSDADSA